MRSLCVMCLFAAAGFAQEPPKPADPPPAKPADAVPGTFRAFVVSDARTDPKDPKGKRNVTGFQHDLIVANELNPTVVVFAHELPKADGGVSKLAATLKELAATYKPNDFGAYLFFNTLKESYTADALKAKPAADALKTWADAAAGGGVVVALSEKESKQTKAWGLTGEGVVVVFYNRLKVVKRWTLTEDTLTAEAIDAIAAEVNKELKK